ncbi:GNAT family N-acetyltransferase [Hydrogenophaga sp.]|uniref:GNAT family N-acetyltransferase n=1 Tax=Hydrogenophaga sp. TaxID=1904254 RepID=UPI00257991F4|nr:GNAT family N-acetyltransferase [Hydrogenophaga sp.]
MVGVSPGPLRAPEPLTAEHDSSAFVCKHPALTEWLQKRALSNQASGASSTYVVCTADRAVVGYYALAPGAVAHAVATGPVRRNMPSPVPVFVLGRLAVRADWGGRGIGAGLLRDALLRSAQAARIVGGRALLCHAIDDEARSFYLRHGFQPSGLEPMTLMVGLQGLGPLV